MWIRRASRECLPSPARVVASNPPVHSVTASPLFKTVLYIVSGLTLVALLGAVILPYLPFKSAANTSDDNLWTVAKMGFGAIVGLLGGKAA